MDLVVMTLTNRCSQVDNFARKFALSAIFSMTLSLYIFRKNIRAFSAVHLLCFVITFVVFLIILNEILHRKWLQPMISPNGKAVLITGCDCGFGHGFAKTLADAGFQVFAGCLHPSHGEAASLNRHPRISCLRMDVTKPNEIQLVFDYIVRHLHENELWAVINNAGISKGSDIEATSMQKIEEVIDVNLMGTIRVTKTFLPLLQKSKGRIVNVASAAAHQKSGETFFEKGIEELADRFDKYLNLHGDYVKKKQGRLLLPGFLPYSVSKNAVIAFSDGLRLEMRKYDVHVISIEPWIYRTRLSDISRISTEIEKEWRSATDSTSAKTNSTVTALQRSATNLFTWGVSSNLEEVFDTVKEALTVQCPPYRYSPGKWYLNAAVWVLYYVPKPVNDFILCNFIFKR